MSTQSNSKSQAGVLNGIFFFSYFGLGALLPLLTIYLEGIGFSGVQIGTITSSRALLGIFIPPMWGLISDRTHRHKGVLILTFVMSFVALLLLPNIRSFGLFIAAYMFLNAFQTASTPLSDSIALHSTTPFGSIRKWGAYGYAIAALASGYLAGIIDISFIFIVYGFSVVMAIVFSSRLHIDIPKANNNLTKQLPLLFKNRDFLIFLLFCFLVGGTLIGHNAYFGPYFTSLGGNVEWVGLAFFMFALSEAPFMSFTNKAINRFGVYNVLIFSACMGILRWTVYFLQPHPYVVLFLFPLQGLFFGVFIATTAEYIKETINPAIRSTAVTTYSAVFLGLGGVFTNYVGGYIYDYVNVHSIYAFLAGCCALGLLVIIYLKKTAPIKPIA